MRHWPVLALIAFSFLCCGDSLWATPLAENERPNILWLTVEDVGPELGCYGDTNANTPALDAFAKISLRYKTAWSTYPVCAPARTTIITGRYASSMAAGNMRSQVPLPADTIMFPALLRKAGYYCTNQKKEDYNLFKPDGVWDESGGKAHYRNRKPGQPFFAVFNNTKTHESKIRNRPHDAVTDPAKLTLAPFWPDLPEIREDLGQYYDNIHNMDTWFQGKLDELERAGEKDNTIVFFYGDHGSGMPRFKRYAGDTGYKVAMMVHVPEKFRQWATDYEVGQVSDRLVGFVDLAPTVLSLCAIEPPASMEGRAWFGPYKKRGDEFLFGFRERMDEWVDLSHCVRNQKFQYSANYMPHLPAGQPLAYQMQTPATKKWFEAFGRGETTPVQSQFWKPRAAEELYDIVADPYGINNLAADPAYAEQLASLRAAHRKQALATADWSFVPEPISLALIDMRETEEGTKFTRAAFEAAQVAALQSANPASDQQVLAMLGDANAAVRYWGTVGIQQRLDRMKDSAPSLEGLLADGEQVVQVAAAEALCRLDKALAEVKVRAVERLLTLADQRNSGYLVAVAAFNALDRQKDLLDSKAIQRISGFPDKAVGRKRGIDDLEKLKARF